MPNTCHENQNAHEHGGDINRHASVGVRLKRQRGEEGAVGEDDIPQKLPCSQRASTEDSFQGTLTHLVHEIRDMKVQLGKFTADTTAELKVLALTVEGLKGCGLCAPRSSAGEDDCIRGAEYAGALSPDCASAQLKSDPLLLKAVSNDCLKCTAIAFQTVGTDEAVALLSDWPESPRLRLLHRSRHGSIEERLSQALGFQAKGGTAQFGHSKRSAGCSRAKKPIGNHNWPLESSATILRYAEVCCGGVLEPPKHPADTERR
ncbi:hypothetical protein PAXINDRAFT_14955 [Paxillus involutus ATCC 200175]|uniref:Uncharacterized protein n=1 Tax=Paxillus involutus ATCC 200175 TaxID=664439 RepID=A0A0C9TNW5_PAXIN|nr:hypothetical protein PAXINDRAFT_14955 [Paxillus involutus ATCC 200175]